jgi:uncharacterized membrane protein
MKNNTITAEAGKPCDCCHRVHRKLYLVDGYRLGKTCAEQYQLFKRWKNITDIVWKGYEKQYQKIVSMIKPQTGDTQ